MNTQDKDNLEDKLANDKPKKWTEAGRTAVEWLVKKSCETPGGQVISNLLVGIPYLYGVFKNEAAGIENFINQAGFFAAHPALTSVLAEYTIPGIIPAAEIILKSVALKNKNETLEMVSNGLLYATAGAYAAAGIFLGDEFRGAYNFFLNMAGGPILPPTGIHGWPFLAYSVIAFKTAAPEKFMNMILDIHDKLPGDDTAKDVMGYGVNAAYALIAKNYLFLGLNVVAGAIELIVDTSKNEKASNIWNPVQSLGGLGLTLLGIGQGMFAAVSTYNPILSPHLIMLGAANVASSDPGQIGSSYKGGRSQRDYNEIAEAPAVQRKIVERDYDEKDEPLDEKDEPLDEKDESLDGKLNYDEPDEPIPPVMRTSKRSGSSFYSSARKSIGSVYSSIKDSFSHAGNYIGSNIQRGNKTTKSSQSAVSPEEKERYSEQYDNLFNLYAQKASEEEMGTFYHGILLSFEKNPSGIELFAKECSTRGRLGFQFISSLKEYANNNPAAYLPLIQKLNDELKH